MSAAEHEFSTAARVKEAVESILRMRPNQLSMDSMFESFGIDSIMAMELVTKLSAKFGIKIAPAQFVHFKTVSALATHIELQLQSNDRGGHESGALLWQ